MEPVLALDLDHDPLISEFWGKLLQTDHGRLTLVQLLLVSESKRHPVCVGGLTHLQSIDLIHLFKFLVLLLVFPFLYLGHSYVIGPSSVSIKVA